MVANQAIRHCTACGYEDDAADARFCSKCGTTLHRPTSDVPCPHCAGKCKPDAIYCPQCGTKLPARPGPLAEPGTVRLIRPPDSLSSRSPLSPPPAAPSLISAKAGTDRPAASAGGRELISSGLVAKKRFAPSALFHVNLPLVLLIGALAGVAATASYFFTQATADEPLLPPAKAPVSVPPAPVATLPPIAPVAAEPAAEVSVPASAIVEPEPKTAEPTVPPFRALLANAKPAATSAKPRTAPKPLSKSPPARSAATARAEPVRPVQPPAAPAPVAVAKPANPLPVEAPPPVKHVSSPASTEAGRATAAKKELNECAEVPALLRFVCQEKLRVRSCAGRWGKSEDCARPTQGNEPIF